MSGLPDNNVYGFLYSDVNQEIVADILKHCLAMSDSEIYVYTSQFDKGQSLHIRTDSFEFETQRIIPENIWLFNGTVGGDHRSVLQIVRRISDCLGQSGHKTKFEIYDDQANLLAEYPKMMKIELRVTSDTYGSPSPPIPDGTIIILLQDGQAKLGRYEQPKPPENPMPSFSHPQNVDELASAALEAILESCPEQNLYGHSQVFTCPMELAQKAIWEADEGTT